MTAPCHPADVPEGVPHGHPWAERGRAGCGCIEGPGLWESARSVWRQVDRMALGRCGEPNLPREPPEINDRIGAPL